MRRTEERVVVPSNGLVAGRLSVAMPAAAEDYPFLGTGRQLDVERGAGLAVLPVSDRQVAAVGSGDTASDGQTETRAFAVRAMDEALEDPLPGFRRYSGTVVLHEYAGGVDGEADRPGARLPGVVDEVGEDLGQPLRVGGDDGRAVDLDLQVGCDQPEASGL